MEKQILLTTTEVADYLKVPRSTISSKLDRNEMPEPDATTYAGRPLWKIETIEHLGKEIVRRKSKHRNNED